MQVRDLTVEELKLIIPTTVADTLQDLLTEMDEGKELKPTLKQELIDSLARTRSGERGTSAEEVVKKLGLNW